MGLVEPVPAVPLDRLGRVHFVGIGGAGMSGIARIMLARGVWVSGSDRSPSAQLDELAGLGAAVYVGHAAEHVAGVDTVVTTPSAIGDRNLEIVAARQLGIPVIPRAAALASIMTGKRGIAVSGTHGKTTTTSMLTTVLRHGGADPSYVIGGILAETGLGADEGSGDWFVAEADESDGSFLMLSPTAAIVTCIEAEHLDNYKDLAEIEATFAAFIGKLPDGGLLVAGQDDPRAAALAAAAARTAELRVRTYGESPEADYRVTGVTGLGIATPLTVELGLPPGVAASGLAAYRGVARRMEPKGEADGVRVLDCYAHHPTEIAADLTAAREVADGGQVIAVFQPHLYSRTRFFAAEFGAALGLADEALVLDVYAAREAPEPGVTGMMIVAAVPGGRARFVPDAAAVPDVIAGLAKPGDLVLTMGAGDVTLLGPKIVAALRERAG